MNSHRDDSWPPLSDLGVEALGYFQTHFQCGFTEAYIAILQA